MNSRLLASLCVALALTSSLSAATEVVPDSSASALVFSVVLIAAGAFARIKATK